MKDSELQELDARARAGGSEKYHEKNTAEGKLFARARLALLLDADSFVEDALLANSSAEGLPADRIDRVVVEQLARAEACAVDDLVTGAGGNVRGIRI